MSQPGQWQTPAGQGWQPPSPDQTPIVPVALHQSALPDEPSTPTAPRGVRGWRRWKVAVPALLLALVCSLGWAAFVLVRTGDYPGGRVASGENWTAPEGHTARLVAWRETKELTDDHGSVKQAVEGTTWVYVEMEFKNLSGDAGCVFMLSGDDGMRWRPASGAPLLPGDTYCAKDKGRDHKVHQIYSVPTTMLGKLRGVELDHSMMLRQPPLFAKP